MAPVRIGDTQACIHRVAIEPAPLRDIFDKGDESQGNLLNVTVSIQNLSKTKKIEYTPWGGNSLGISEHPPIVKDHVGNLYLRVGFGFGTHIRDAVEHRKSIYPDEALFDLLVFQRPVDGVAHLDIALPASACGETGEFRFRIPAASIGRR